MFFVAVGKPFHFVDADICLAFQKTFGQTDVRVHAAEEIHDVTILDQQAREVFDIQIVKQVGMILDIDPEKNDVRVFFGKRPEQGLIGATSPAPLRAKAGNDP